MSKKKKMVHKKESKIVLPLIILLIFLSTTTISDGKEPENTPLFDIQVTIPTQYQKIFPGKEVLASIRLVNLAGPGRVDVFLDYWITDEEEDLILEKKETVAVETQASFVRTFKLPEEGEPGTYTLFAKLTYGEGREAHASQTFVIAENEEPKREEYKTTGMLFLALLLLFYVCCRSKNFWKKLAMRMKARRIVRKRRKENS